MESQQNNTCNCNDNCKCKSKKNKWRGNAGNGAFGGALFMGFIGALVHYMQHASTFGEGILGVLKAIVWPAMLVYHAFEFLNK